jgi:aminoglycoside phosphotransferase family enzyme
VSDVDGEPIDHMVVMRRMPNDRRLSALVRADAPLADTVNRLARVIAVFHAGREKLFDTRIADGRIVHGHGDLLADDIFCLDDGPRVLDCLEFDDRLRDGRAVPDGDSAADEGPTRDRTDTGCWTCSLIRRRRAPP